MDIKKIKLPEIDNVEKFIKEMYKEKQSDKNNLSDWFPKVAACGIKVPNTIIIPLTYGQFKWLGGDNYKDEDVKEMGTFILGCIKGSSLKDTKKLFMKTGTFSNKFDFSTCKVENLNNIGDQFLSIYYAAMCVGDGTSTEIVIREFIESEADKTIYNGMPLSTEFRVFYDFDNKKVLEVFSYWDRETMTKSLTRSCAINDAKVFLSAIDGIEKTFEENKDKVSDMVGEAMKNIELTGKWSIDIMKAKDGFYLIDMATAETSYYYNKVVSVN